MDGKGDTYSQAVKAAVDAGRKIEAIKIYREETGVGLKEAKEAVDFLVRQRKGSPTADNSDMAEPGSGSASLIKLVLLVAALIVAYKVFFAG
jgi:hypothetical protein